MNKILIVSGHPDISNDSVANKAALEEFHRLLPDAEIDRLNVLYPDYKIDVEAEQAKLMAADTIVFQYPVFWYGMPALIQKWVEDVFAHGFSHGSSGKALVGKNLILSMTLGAPENHYGGETAVRLEDLLPPAKGMCEASGMNFIG